MAARNKLARAVLVFVLIRERNLERHAEDGHAQAAIVRFDLVIADRKFQAIIYMEMIDAEILPIQKYTPGPCNGTVVPIQLPQW